MAYSRKHSNIIAVSCLAGAALLPLSSSAQRASVLAPDSNYLKAAVMAARESSTVKQKKSGEQLLKEIQHRLQQRYGKTNPTLEAIMIKLLAATDITNAALLLSPSELKELKDLGVEISDLTALRNEIKDSEGIVPTDISPTGGEAFKSSNNTASSQKPNKPTTEKTIDPNGGKSFPLNKEDYLTGASDSPMVNANGSSEPMANPDRIQDTPITNLGPDQNYANNFDPTGGSNNGSGSPSNGSAAPSVRGNGSAGRNLADGGTGSGQPSGAAAPSAGSGAGGHSAAAPSNATQAVRGLVASPTASKPTTNSPATTSNYKPSADDLSAGGIESAKRQYKFYKPTLDALQKSGQLNTPLGQKVQGLVGKYENILKQSDSSFDFAKLRSCERDCNNRPTETKAELKSRMFKEFLEQGDVLTDVEKSSLLKAAEQNFAAKYVAKDKLPRAWPTDMKSLKGSILNPDKDNDSKFIYQIARLRAYNEHVFPNCQSAPIYCREELDVAKEISNDLYALMGHCRQKPETSALTRLSIAWPTIMISDLSPENTIRVTRKEINKAKDLRIQMPNQKISTIVDLLRKNGIQTPSAAIISSDWENAGAKFCTDSSKAFLSVSGTLLNKLGDLNKPNGSEEKPEPNHSLSTNHDTQSDL